LRVYNTDSSETAGRTAQPAVAAVPKGPDPTTAKPNQLNPFIGE